MNSMEQRKQIDERKTALEERLSHLFESKILNGEKCFVAEERVFIVSLFYSRGAVVIEYADSMAAAIQNAYEDGDLFFLEEMDEEEMFQAILQEINQS